MKQIAVLSIAIAMFACQASASIAGSVRSVTHVELRDFLLEHRHRIAQAFGGAVEFAQRHRGLPRAVDHLAHRVADLGQLSCAEDEQDDHQDHEQLAHSQSEHDRDL